MLNQKLEDFKKNIKGKKIAVLGLGRSNIPAIKYLHSLGANISARDLKEDIIKTKDELEGIGIEVILGSKYLDNLNDYDYILRSPGIKPFLNEIENAKKAGVKLTSEIELLIELAPCKIIGVTGSDGKTTTTTLISKFLKEAGYTVHIGGNIGYPIFANIDNMKSEDIIVMELSSFQLMTLNKSPNISVITNISPNHLDYHRDFEEYILAKANIFNYQNENNILVLNEDNKEFTKKYLDIIAKKDIKTVIRKFSIEKNVENGAYFSDNKIILRKDNKNVTICKKEQVKLVGMHNIANICAAISAVYDFVTIQDILNVITTFGGVEHRMEFVRELNNVKWYNDSIASSPTRTIAGLVSFNKKVILIAGGYDKKISYDVIGKYIIDKVKELILVGATSEKIKEAVIKEAKKQNIDLDEKINIIKYNNLSDAVNHANKIAKKGDIVVMSPASASFDMYKDFEERGNYFKNLVNSLN